jgi:hypothetical protein
MATKKPKAVEGKKTEVVKLTAVAVSTKGQVFHPGMRIAPDVEGWPAHRVASHLKDGRAVVEQVAEVASSDAE